MRVLDLGLIDYSEAYKIQKKTAPEALIIAEHPPVFTLGRTGSRENLLVDEEVLERKKIKLIETDRGGDITFHGPGQIVLYPIIDLKEKKRNLHKYIRSLEEAVIGFLGGYGIEARRVKGSSGVWAGDKKIGFVGVGASHWITYHGISVNINTDLSYFSMIRSCGIKGIEITSLSKILNKPIGMNEAKERLILNFNKIFEPKDAVSEISAVA